MKRQLVVALAMLGLSLSAFALEPNPMAGDGGVLDVPSSDRAVLTAYADQPTFSAAAGATVVIDFEDQASGTVVTNHYAGAGIAMISGTSDLGATSQYVYSSAGLPFPMFTAGTLPSETNFLANNWNAPIYCTGKISFELVSTSTAIGAFVADGSPLGDFAIELFDEDSNSLGAISVSPRTLPDSFVGVISDTPFKSATFYSMDAFDSWGLDNLEFLPGSTATEEGTWSDIKAMY